MKPVSSNHNHYAKGFRTFIIKTYPTDNRNLCYQHDAVVSDEELKYIESLDSLGPSFENRSGRELTWAIWSQKPTTLLEASESPAIRLSVLYPFFK